MKYAPTLDLDDAPVERSDMELVERTRAGDKDAFGDLWTRHYHAAIRAARSISFNHEPEDLAQEAFMRIYHAILQGRGPKEVFRAYMYTVLRSVSMNWDRGGSADTSLDDIAASEEPTSSFEGRFIDGSITARAFTTLKSEWRAVLWYLDVEEMRPKEVAPMLGLSANATSALAYRAREALRSAWLQAHVNSENADAQCKWTVERLGVYNRGALTIREKNKLQEHLTACLKCSILVEEVDHLSKNLGIFLLPMLVGPQAFSLVSAINHGGRVTGPVPPNPVGNPVASASKLALGVLTSVVTASGLIVASILMFNSTPSGTATVAAGAAVSAFPPKNQDSPITTSDPAVVEIPDVGAAEPIIPRPVTTTQRLSAPGVPVVPTPSQSPVVPTSPPTANPTPQPMPSAPVIPVMIAAPSIDSVTEDGLFLPLLKGSGVPSASVTVLSAGETVGSALVDAAGSWAVIPEVTLVANGPVSFSAYQSHRGLVSDTSEATEPVTIATPGLGTITYSNGTGNVSFGGPTGSTVEVLIDGVSTGNQHQMDGNLVNRLLPSLTPGQHSLSLRFIDQNMSRYGAGLYTEFDVPPARRDAPSRAPTSTEVPA